MIRLGRISYVNMAPVFFELEADVEEVSGVPCAIVSTGSDRNETIVRDDTIIQSWFSKQLA